MSGTLTTSQVTEKQKQDSFGTLILMYEKKNMFIVKINFYTITSSSIACI